MKDISEKPLALWRKIATFALSCLLFAILVEGYSGRPKKTISTTNDCICNLRQLEQATQQWALEHQKQPADSVQWTDIAPYLKNKFICGKRGQYAIGPVVSNAPSCSFPDHRLPDGNEHKPRNSLSK